MYRAIAVILVFIGLMVCPSAYADPRDGTDGGLTWGACTGPVEGYFATGGVLPADELNEWHHVALVEDGTKGIAYLDGKSRLVVSDGDANRPSAPYAPLEGHHPVRIGFAIGVNGNIADEAYVDGIIDEVLLYNRPPVCAWCRS